MPRIDTIVVHAGPQGPTGPTGTNIYVQPGDPGSVPDGTLWLDTDDTTPDTSLNWGNIAGTLSNQTDLQTALNGKANVGAIASPLTTKGDLYGYTTTNARVPAGADGTVLVADSTQASGLGYGYRAAPFPRFASTYLMLAGHQSGATALNVGTSIAANTLYAFPIEIGLTETFTFCTLVNVTAASTAGSARLGFGQLTAATNWQTMQVLHDFGTVSTATTGTKSISGLSFTHPPGWYFILMVADQPFSCSGYTATRGFGQQTTSSSIKPYLATSLTYGALATSYLFGVTDFGANPTATLVVGHN